MAQDWLADVKKYEPNADEAAVAGIVRHCGIALRNRDSSLVSFTDKAETDRVRTNFLKKKLGRTESDAVLDQAIDAVRERMKGDRTKNRVTVYYLLAEHFGQLPLFYGKAKAAAGGASTGVGTPAADESSETSSGGATAAGLAAGAGALGLAGAGAAAAEAAATPPAPPPPPAVPPASAGTGSASGGGYGGTGASGGSGSGSGGAQGFADVPQGGGGSRWWLWALLALLALLILFFLLRSCQQQPVATGSFNATEANTADVDTSGTGANDDMMANASGSADELDGNAGTSAVVPPAAPAGAGVTETTSNGAPALNVYFDKGKSDVTADFSAAATKLTAYLSAHPGATLAVSGYNDPSGNAAVNAAISKERAQHVAAALKAAGVPDSAVALVKPSDTTIASTDPNAARRVEVTVKQ